MKVFVVMGNDYPDSVWRNEKEAEEYCELKKSDKTTQTMGHARIYWRTYEFKLR